MRGREHARTHVPRPHTQREVNKGKERGGKERERERERERRGGRETDKILKK